MYANIGATWPENYFSGCAAKVTLKLRQYSYTANAANAANIHLSYSLAPYKQLYCLLLGKFVYTNLPWAGFELGSLGLQAGVQPIEPPLPVQSQSKIGLITIA